MKQNKKVIEDLKRKFENFLFHLDDYLEELLEISTKQGYKLDYSMESLRDLESFILKNNITEDDNFIDGLSAYFGEVVRKNIGGVWKCSLDISSNSLYYGKPVISEYTTPKDLELSPYDSVINFISEPQRDFFITIIENDLDDTPLDLDDIPTEG